MSFEETALWVAIGTASGLLVAVILWLWSKCRAAFRRWRRKRRPSRLAINGRIIGGERSAE